ncbi:MAG: xanthine dehydrogenase molybdopterin binding subunit [Alphaproteobacteria bacterium]
MAKRRAGNGAAAGVVHRPIAHDSAEKHVTGAALYVDDVPEPPGTLFAAFGLSARPHARLTSVDLAPVRAAPGVVAVMAAADIPGQNDCAPVFADDPIFADGVVEHVGQCIFAVAAATVEQARRAARLARIEYEDLPALLTVEDALAAKSLLEPPQVMKRGDAARAIARAKHRRAGRFGIGGQEHFYLEGQVAFAIPGEGRDMLVLSSTQSPTEIQHVCAAALGIPDAAVTAECRRMGGAFGGKETQGALFAAVAALLAWKTGRPVKVRADRDDDMEMTGKRHDFAVGYEVGFDDAGRIQGVDFMLASRCGRSADLSLAINDRAMMHCDNAYYLPNVSVASYRCKTHTVSNTAFRGFGGPQGMMAIEYVLDEIAHALGKDPLDVRRANLYGGRGRNVTPYHMRVDDNVAPALMAELATSADYRRRRAEIADFNAKSPILKRGLALTPAKFGISFTATHLNQAGALVHLYTDGSVHLNHGGTEMGQGLFTKVAQVVADEFGASLDRVQITATSTGKVPNTTPTAASAGSDMNGMAARNAARTIKARLLPVAAAELGCAPGAVVFAGNRVRGGGRSMTLAALAKKAFLARVSLSAAGYYRTPKIHFDRARWRGRPFYYFAYGAAASEIVLDTLTGEHRLLRVDILHDVGRSLNPAIDLGQIEGGFIQGAGWLTSEELVWDAKGRLATHAPSTYKIPAASDCPADFRVSIWRKGRNREAAIHRSKAVGEPPLMLAISVFHAIKDAAASAAGRAVRLDAPATPERVLLALEDAAARKREAVE